MNIVYLCVAVILTDNQVSFLSSKNQLIIFNFAVFCADEGNAVLVCFGGFYGFVNLFFERGFS